MKLSVCMIVKNEEERLRECLDSVKDFASEIIIVDTGSSDRTKEAAREFTNKIYDFVWIDDFSKARNYAISKAEGEWILSLDADEKISKIDCKKMVELLKRDEADAYYLEWNDYSNNKGVKGWKAVRINEEKESKGLLGFTTSRVLRLFKNKKGYHFSGRIHETINKSIEEGGGIIENSDLVIHHYGHLRNKEEVDYSKILKERIKEGDFKEKEEYFVLYELGRELVIKNKLEEAKETFEKSLAIKDDYAPTLSSLGAIHLQSGDIDKAESIIKKSLLVNGGDDSAHANLGIIYSKKGLYNKAIRKLERAIEINNQSADHYYNLGLIYERMGKEKKAEECFDRARELNPSSY